MVVERTIPVGNCSRCRAIPDSAQVRGLLAVAGCPSRRFRGPDPAAGAVTDRASRTEIILAGIPNKFAGGGGWIRTNVGARQRIYSPPPLATRAPLRAGKRGLEPNPHRCQRASGVRQLPSPSATSATSCPVPDAPMTRTSTWDVSLRPC